MTERGNEAELEAVTKSREKQEEDRADYVAHGPKINVMYGPDDSGVVDDSKATRLYCEKHWQRLKDRASESGEKIEDVDTTLSPLLVNDTVKLMFHESEKGALPEEIEEKMHCCQKHFAEAASAFVAMKAPLCCYVASAPEGVLENSPVEVMGTVGPVKHNLLDEKAPAAEEPTQFPMPRPKHVC